MQTSLATRPNPRASAYERGLTCLNTSQSTYANHKVIFKPYAYGEHKCGVATPLYLSLAPSHLVWPVGSHIYSPKQRYGRWNLGTAFLRTVKPCDAWASNHLLWSFVSQLLLVLELAVTTFFGSIRPNGEHRTISVGPSDVQFSARHTFVFWT